MVGIFAWDVDENYSCIYITDIFEAFLPDRHIRLEDFSTMCSLFDPPKYSVLSPAVQTWTLMMMMMMMRMMIMMTHDI